MDAATIARADATTAAGSPLLASRPRFTAVLFGATMSSAASRTDAARALSFVFPYVVTMYDRRATWADVSPATAG